MSRARLRSGLSPLVSLCVVTLLAFFAAPVIVASATPRATPAASAAWSINHTPDTTGPQNDHLTSISCPSPSFCVAVGYYNNGTVHQNLIVTWNGATWSLDDSPSLSSSVTQGNRLNSVSCVSTAFCVAVGYYDPRSGYSLGLVLTWNGATWSLDDSASLSPPTVTRFATLNGISCVDTSFCVAVGDYSGGSSMSQNFVLTWNGHSWALDDSASLSPPTLTSQFNHVLSISCASTSFCAGVGYYINFSNGELRQNFVLTWNGHSWVLDDSASLSTSSTEDNFLMSVSCASASFCVAVGLFWSGNASKNLLLTWNGSSWTLDDLASLSASSTEGNVLDGVSCASTSFCVADGYIGNFLGGSNVVLSWNGSSWTLDNSASLSTSATEMNALEGISCASASFCVAAGYYDNAAGDSQNLLVTWDGSSWTIDDSASFSSSGPQQDYLSSVSCASPSFCVAAGYYRNAAGESQNLLLTWNGSSWTLDDSASLSTSISDVNLLTSVSCASASFCVAAGYYENNAGEIQNLLLTWNGSSWSLDAAASLSTSATEINSLEGISCASASFCVAAGTYLATSSGSSEHNLILTWNGSSWSLDAAASLSTSSSQDNQVTSVSCTSPSFCIVAGSYRSNVNVTKDPFLTQNFILSWNGTTWSLDDAASLSTSAMQTNQVNAVSCTAPSFCVVAGYYEDSSGIWNLILTWNGFSWSLDAAASLDIYGSQEDQLNAVSCVSSEYCLATGSYFTSANVSQSLVLTRSAGTWQTNYEASLSTSSSQDNYLNSASCMSTSFCVAAGYYYNGVVNQTLVMSGAVPKALPLTAVQGYWFVASDGGIFSFGDAKFYGSMGARHLNAPIVGMAATPDGKGYWFVASDGGIFSFGDAKFYGSMGARHLNKPIVGMAATPDGKGYWFVASDGGIFSFGDAKFYGSMGARHLNKPIVGMAATPDGKGYWFVASDGGIFSFGDAKFYGSMGAKHLNKPIVGMAATPDGKGYWFIASDGGIFSFGDAKFYGSMGAKHLNKPIVGMAS